LDHTFREEDRVVIAEFHGVGPFRGTVIQADDEQVEVLVDEQEGNKHFCTVYSENFRLLSHEGIGMQLFRKESNILVDVLETLRSEGIVALPVHDDVVVRDDNSDKAKAVIKKVFREHTGITPDVTLG
jgi:hypothetical protein